ncbi:Uncharacterised protein [Chlamydia trachomatis]|nr:Uncharacterised protein [Chlamydia trachomatis]
MPSKYFKFLLGEVNFFFIYLFLFKLERSLLDMSVPATSPSPPPLLPTLPASNPTAAPLPRYGEAFHGESAAHILKLE